MVLLLCAVFYQRAAYNLARVDFRNSNFFVFWLAGRMAWSGENPYDAAQWSAGHDAYGVTWRPNSTFLYPLPVMFLVAPLALLPLAPAYFIWELVSEGFIALAAWTLLAHWPEATYRRMIVPLLLFLLFFGPIYLTLQVGAPGAFVLIIVVAAIAAWEHDQSLLAGGILSLTLLKPPQGATILLLATAWVVVRRDWKAIYGMLLGSLVLMAVGMLRDPIWIVGFLNGGQIVLDQTLGLQSNTLGLASLLCKSDPTCTWLVGGLGAALVLAATAYLLWRQAATLGAWQAFNVIIPAAFVSTIYLWSYDQVLYVIPVVWIVAMLVERSRSYFRSFLFLVVLVGISLANLYLQATTRNDLLSFATTGLVFAACLWLGPRSRESDLHPTSAI